MTLPVRWKVGQCDVFRILEGQHIAAGVVRALSSLHPEHLPVTAA